VIVLAPGTLIDRRWRLVRPLGQGGMGVVWAAEHARLGRAAALKFLRVEFANDERSLRRFQQEATAAGRIGSPHIVGMLDFGTAPDGSPFLAMELLDGETLWEAMDGGAARFPPGTMSRRLHQTCGVAC
jgi:serine/threonine-protein kinase